MSGILLLLAVAMFVLAMGMAHPLWLSLCLLLSLLMLLTAAAGLHLRRQQRLVADPRRLRAVTGGMRGYDEQ